MFPESSSVVGPSPAVAAQRNQRYVYLVARLRNRQMTMEEATELFGLMDGMLRTSEAARSALARAVPSTPAAMEAPKPKAAAPGAPAAGGDDFLLLGILAMGAGAGLLAAMTRRIQEATPPSDSAPTSGSRTGSPPR